MDREQERLARVNKHVCLYLGMTFVAFVWLFTEVVYVSLEMVSFWVVLPLPVVTFALTICLLVACFFMRRLLREEIKKAQASIDEKLDDALAQEGKPSRRR